ncbi:MAG: SpoIIE family protein phosphatase [Methylococcaceae bacterium]
MGINTGTLHYAAFTHPGKQFKQNQDALLVAGCMHQTAGFWQGELCLDKPCRFAVADGAGGLPSAAKASRTLLQSLLELDEVHPDWLPRQRLSALHHRLVVACQHDRTLINAGATLVTAEIALDGHICLWHAGDSRGYHVRQQGLRQLTDDHTLAYCLRRTEQQSDSEHQAINNSYFGQALDNLFVYSSVAEAPFIGLQRLKLAAGERLLLLSDGVTLHLSDDLLRECLEDMDTVSAIQRIFAAVMASDAEDNASAILIATT